jgi:capsular polysaccharide biosynthesis protein
MEEIELKYLFQVMLKRWWIIVSFTASALIIGTAYSFFIAKPVYQSNTSIYIGKNAESQSATIAYNDVLLNDRLVNDYRELVQSRLIADAAIKELNLNDITDDKFAKKLNVTSKKDTHLIVISATDENPEFAKVLADKVAEVFQKKAVEIMKVENIQIIDKAVAPDSPIKPNKKMNIAISFLIGIMLGIGVVFIIEYLDDTIKTPEDVKKYLDLPIIGTIPIFPE